VAKLSDANRKVALEIISRYPRARSATIPLLHLAQEQDGHVTDEAMEDIAGLVGCTPAEVLGTSSFYEMLKQHPVGTYAVNVCTDISCLLVGGNELLAHLEETLDVKAGGTTADGTFTLEGVECIAACTEAPCLQANYRYFTRLDADAADQVIDDLRSGALADEVPEHGTLARIRQRIPADRRAGNALPDGGDPPEWYQPPAPEPAAGQ
jgi:NADH-quinone oxidoreductase subunit E